MPKDHDLLVRIAEKVEHLPKIYEKLERLTIESAQHRESLKWLTWAVRGGVVGMASAFFYIIFKV